MFEIEAMSKALLAGMKIKRGRVVAICEDGVIQVESDAEGLPVSCEFLRTSSGLLPELHVGDAVLYVLEEAAMRGYVLGVIQKYGASAQTTNDKLRHSTNEQEVRELKFNAAEKIEFRCGESTLLMNKNGKIVMKGRNITSRAREAQKIKGATVNLN